MDSFSSKCLLYTGWRENLGLMSIDTGVFTVYGNITVAFCNPLPFYFLSWQRLAVGVAAVVLCSIAALLRQAALAGVIFGSHLVLILSWFSYGLFLLPLPSTPSPASTFTPLPLFLTSSSPSLFCTFSPSPPVCLLLTPPPVFLCMYLCHH